MLFIGSDPGRAGEIVPHVGNSLLGIKSVSIRWDTKSVIETRREREREIALSKYEEKRD